MHSLNRADGGEGSLDVLFVLPEVMGRGDPRRWWGCSHLDPLRNIMTTSKHVTSEQVYA